MGIINRLGARVEIKLKVKPVPPRAHEADVRTNLAVGPCSHFSTRGPMQH